MIFLLSTSAFTCIFVKKPKEKPKEIPKEDVDWLEYWLNKKSER